MTHASGMDFKDSDVCTNLTRKEGKEWCAMPCGRTSSWHRYLGCLERILPQVGKEWCARWISSRLMFLFFGFRGGSNFRVRGILASAANTTERDQQDQFPRQDSDLLNDANFT